MVRNSNAILAFLLTVSVITGGACLVLTRATRSGTLEILAETVEPENTDASIPDPVPSERYVPYVWRWQDLYAPVERHLEPRTSRSVSGNLTLAWDGVAKFLQIAPDAAFSGERLHLQVPTGGRARVTQVFAGKNFWRVSEDGRRWSRALPFEIEPEFLPGVPVIEGASTLKLSGFSSYIVEYATDPSFRRARAIFLEQSTWRPGARGFVRARGINSRGEVSEASAPFALP